jgi:putative thiamine transport system permease protein
VYRLYVEAAPRLAILALTVAVLGGLAGIAAPAFGWLPALGGTRLSLAPWRELAAVPGLAQMVGLSLLAGLASAAIALAVVLAFVAAFHRTRAFALVERSLSPILSIPHAAAAIGFAFLVAPSGLLARLASPGLTGWQRPPDLLVVGDPWGLTMIAALVVKEVAFLLLMTLAVLPQTGMREQLPVARMLGYRPVAAFAKVVLPRLYPLIRLPLYAVVAYASSTVEVALILGPSTPPPLAVAVVRWMNDPDLQTRFMASAAALLQVGVTFAALALWRLAEVATARLARGWLTAGGRGAGDRTVAVIGAVGVAFTVTAAAGGVAALAIWSIAGFWRFPDALPGAWSPRAWETVAAAPDLVTNAAVVGLAATAAAVVLVVGALEHETARGRPAGRAARLVLYLPLLVPAVAFLFGLVLLAERAGVAPGLALVVAGHVVFVLPYVYLALAEAYRRLDPRWSAVARALGASPGRAFLAVRLPLLSRAVLTAAAVGFAVSIGQYLPTQLLGAGRVPTITTEAVALAAGGDRRLAAAYGLAQSLLPFAGFWLAYGVPRLVFRHRRGMGTGT